MPTPVPESPDQRGISTVILDWFAGRVARALVPALCAMEGRIVSVLSDKIAAAATQQASTDASLDAAITRVGNEVQQFRTTIDELNAKIDELQAKVDAGGATQEDLDALDALTSKAAAMQAKVDALDFTNPAVLPPE